MYTHPTANCPTDFIIRFHFVGSSFQCKQPFLLQSRLALLKQKSDIYEQSQIKTETELFRLFSVFRYSVLHWHKGMHAI